MIGGMGLNGIRPDESWRAELNWTKQISDSPAMIGRSNRETRAAPANEKQTGALLGFLSWTKLLCRKSCRVSKASRSVYRCTYLSKEFFDVIELEKREQSRCFVFGPCTELLRCFVDRRTANANINLYEATQTILLLQKVQETTKNISNYTIPPEA